MSAQSITDDSQSKSSAKVQNNQDNSPHESTQKEENYAKSSPTNDTPVYLMGSRLFFVMLTLFMSTLLTALEIGIIATAIPGITDRFHQLDHVGWYGSATFILAGASSPTWGKTYKYCNVRIVYLVSIALFLIGSLVAASAPNSVAVIIGRAMQGLGGSGTLSGSVLIINYVAKPELRPMLIGGWIGVFMVSTILGPVVGGAFTGGVSWRWCFWINLPLGGPIVVMILIFLHMPRHIKPAPATWREIILQLDLPGFSLLLTSLVCFTLALQWGGQTKIWGDGHVVATLVLWIVLTLAFFTTEWFQGGRAMVPLQLLSPRVIWSNALYCFMSNAVNFQVIFYLPIYFQSIHGQSALMGGINTLPFLAFFAAGAMTSGVVVGKTRYLQPFELLSGLLITAGSALIYLMDVDTSQARYIGPQILFGFGIGFGSQIPVMAVQTFSKPEDVPNASGIMLMCQSISGGYFIAVAQSLFTNLMLQKLKTIAPNIDPVVVINTGASELHHVFNDVDLRAVREAYMIGIKGVFACTMAGAALTVILAILIPFKKLPEHTAKMADEMQANK